MAKFQRRSSEGEAERKLNISGLIGRRGVNKISLHFWMIQTMFKNKKNKPYDEVLGTAQFTERTSISCQKLTKLSKVVKS